MNILDIDLDFFLRNRMLDTTKEGQRLSVEEYPVWREEEVVSFLETNCGLSTQNPIKGAIFTHHHELFYYVMENGLADVNLYHIDAHEDIYQSNSIEIMSHYMHLSEKEKCNIKNIKPYMDEGNFIVFLAACHRLNSITYINDFNRYRYDVMGLYFKNHNPQDNQFQIGVLPHNYNQSLELEHISFPVREHTIPFHMINYTNYTAEGITFDYIFLSRSPEYTPPEADAFIPLIKRYIRQD